MAIPVAFSTGSLHPFGLDRSYGWAAEAGYDGVEIMMDERWDTHQHAYLDHLIGKHGIPLLALHTPLFKSTWRLGAEETLIRSAKLAAKVGAPVVVVHPPPPRSSAADSRWSSTCGAVKPFRCGGETTFSDVSKLAPQVGEILAEAATCLLCNLGARSMSFARDLLPSRGLAQV